MKTKTKLFLALVIGIASLAIFQPTTSFATQINNVGIAGYGPYQTGQGGEFTFYSPDLSGAIANYYSGAKNQVSGGANFQTFCVEGAEYIYQNSTYDAVLNNHSVNTLVYLTKGAAFLYSQFASGLLGASAPGYDYGNTISRTADAGLLQIAIWHYMGGQEGTGIYDPSNKYEFYAASILGGDALANVAAGSANYGVRVLNLRDPNTPGPDGLRQDMLFWSVPDGGTTAMLLGVGLLGLFLVRRKTATA